MEFNVEKIMNYKKYIKPRGKFHPNWLDNQYVTLICRVMFITLFCQQSRAYWFGLMKKFGDYCDENNLIMSLKLNAISRISIYFIYLTYGGVNR